jgi:hypothetical protein
MFLGQRYFGIWCGCHLLPNPEEEDLVTTNNLLDLCPESKKNLG